MNNWVKMTNDEMEVGIEIATLKKGELQIKYAKDIVAKNKEIERLKEQLNDEIDDELKQSEIMVKQQEEIERLNNIIEQTQKILYIKLMNENKEKIYIQEVIDIIENLKGSDKE